MAKKQQGKGGKPGVIPLGDRVLIKEIPKSEKSTAGGIIIPDSVKSDKGSRRGTVVSVGRGSYDDGKLVPMQVKEGDTVLFGWGDEIAIEGEEYFLVKESEILAIIR
ncbi:MAG: co-chaperone GroES [Candidatus Taylorbacteria bacterium]|nr:co-chaperone GroES [Candidatus Taylorbacteria bacterium]